MVPGIKKCICVTTVPIAVNKRYGLKALNSEESVGLMLLNSIGLIPVLALT